MAGKKGMHDKYRFGTEWQDKLRTKIEAHRIVQKLTEHVINGVEMTPSQVTAGLGLLRKVLPELASTDTTVTHQVSWVDALRRIQDTTQRTNNESNAPQHEPHNPPLH